MRDILTTIGSNPTAYVSLYLFHPMKASTSDDAMKAITCMDALVPGLYIWFGPLVALRRRSLKLRPGGVRQKKDIQGPFIVLLAWLWFSLDIESIRSNRGAMTMLVNR
jgi:hypothetical protein